MYREYAGAFPGHIKHVNIWSTNTLIYILNSSRHVLFMLEIWQDQRTSKYITATIASFNCMDCVYKLVYCLSNVYHHIPLWNFFFYQRFSELLTILKGRPKRGIMAVWKTASFFIKKNKNTSPYPRILQFSKVVLFYAMNQLPTLI